ncbi:uncharacterized protein LACBIDRAFT_313928 [Laccaria bicolor S238N-H82]|uniref:Predicted protein n=1 Tax=Laccaria bicolor (strain S238N-H82 / ATCC MYA-4686) TaxID=486041 RepID=B0D161_LACBS|nr:uncharacterized protein LACBIDRAFT_313928 [Laccaria bicolor S238N-H82]EDR11578.1 predicted protein [Laccaria bicolor S238N-H82]|eukprot:XP_001877475.1 predicted protein [Laccaria bicolor S238N-H82]
MAPKRRLPVQCKICNVEESKYTCSQCMAPYCSVPCYKKHKGSACQSCDPPSAFIGNDGVIPTKGPREEEPSIKDPTPLRPLTSLRWPYVPEESAYPDPLKRDDPKTLQTSQYEAIATSARIRKILADHENLPALLTSIDKLRGAGRDEALQRALGLTEINDQARPEELGEDVLALRELAEAIEAAVRGENSSALGLNWGD